MPDPLIAIAAGALVGTFVGLTGVGGGAIMTPILVLGFGIDPVVAIATDLLFAAVVKIAAGWVHFRGQHVDLQVLRRLWLGSIPACIVVGSVLAIKVEPEQKLLVVRAMGALILVSGLSMLLGHLVQKLSTAKRLADPERFKRPQAALTVVAGALLGSVIAATSIGAGAIGAVLLRARAVRLDQMRSGSEPERRARRARTHAHWIARPVSSEPGKNSTGSRTRW